MEDNLRLKTTFDGGQPLMEDDLSWRLPLMEDDLSWKTAFDGRQPLMGMGGTVGQNQGAHYLD